MTNITRQLRSNCWNEFETSYENFTNSCTDANSITVTTLSHKNLFTKLGLDEKVAIKSKPTTFVCRCMDERCQEISCRDKDTHGRDIMDLAMVGMGALVTDKELKKHIEVILKKGHKNGLKKVKLFPHEGCGAAAIATVDYIKRTGNPNPAPKEVEDYYANRCYETFKKVADYNDYDIKILPPIYQSKDKMMKIGNIDPTQIHPALGVAIVDFVGMDFDRTRPQIYDFLKYSKLPFFLITDYGEQFDDKHDVQEITNWRSTARKVALASHIMEGEHGMGNDFDLPIVFLINSYESQQRANQLIQNIHKNMLKTNFGNSSEMPKHHHFVIVDFSE